MKRLDADHKRRVEKLLVFLKKMIKYWEDTDNTSENKLHGMTMTFLGMLDGCDTAFNGFSLVEKGTGVDLSIGTLHEYFNNYNDKGLIKDERTPLGKP